MKKVLLLLGTLALAGCSDGHMKVSLRANFSNPAIAQIDVHAIGQNVVVKNVEVNGGDCQINRMFLHFPDEIPSGMTASYAVLSTCLEVKKTKITAAEGSYSFSF